MRPVEKGESSQEFKKYQQARQPLEDALGRYCSYCERFLTDTIAVEHIEAKSINPELECEWDNFLLACANCNSTKGNKDVTLTKYYWPDVDNTMRAFQYLDDGRIIPHPQLSPTQQIIAKNTLELTGLHRCPAPDASDKRWVHRKEIWRVANRAYKNLQNCNTSEMREQIVDTAESRGYFSVWMTVFQNDINMQQRFINAFTGTSHACFDFSSGQCVYPPRNPNGL